MSTSAQPASQLLLVQLRVSFSQVRSNIFHKAHKKADGWIIGIRVAVYGTTRPPASGTVSPQSSYTVDRNGPVTYTPPQDGDVQYRQLFYESPTLPNGQHTLTVTNLHDSDEFFLDYFVVFVEDETTVTPPLSSSAAPTVTTTTIIKTSSSREIATSTSITVSPVNVYAGTTSSTVASTTLPSTTLPSATPGSGNVLPSPTNSNNKTTSIAGGIGGAIGGIMLLVIIFLLCARRRQRKAILEREAQRVTSCENFLNSFIVPFSFIYQYHPSVWDTPPVPRNSAWVTGSPAIAHSKSVPALNRPDSLSNSSHGPSSHYGAYAYAQDAFVAVDRGRVRQQLSSSLYNQGPSVHDFSAEPPCYPSCPPSYTHELPEKLRNEFYRMHGTGSNGTGDGSPCY